MIKLEVTVDFFRGEVAPGEKLWCQKGEVVEVSEEAWKNIQRDFNKWFKLIEVVIINEDKEVANVVEKAMEVKLNKMVTKDRIKNK